MRGRRKGIAPAAGLALSAAMAAAEGAPRGEYGRVEIIRDRWEVPHVFAETDAGAMYGLGHAMAEDRAFQMVYNVRIMQGRLAETVGDIAHTNPRRGTAVDSDRRMRTFGFDRAAKAVARSLDEETRALLEAFADGVDAWFAGHRDALPPLFAKYGVVPEPWTPEDSILSWWHFARFFGTDGTRDDLRYRSLVGGRGRRRPGPVDDAAAVIHREDVEEAWIRRTESYLRDHGIDPRHESGPSAAQGPRFSHAWVVGGKRTTTGSAVLVSDPLERLEPPPGGTRMTVLRPPGGSVRRKCATSRSIPHAAFPRPGCLGLATPGAGGARDLDVPLGQAPWEGGHASSSPALRTACGWITGAFSSRAAWSSCRRSSWTGTWCGSPRRIRARPAAGGRRRRANPSMRGPGANPHGVFAGLRASSRTPGQCFGIEGAVAHASRDCALDGGGDTE